MLYIQPKTGSRKIYLRVELDDTPDGPKVVQISTGTSDITEAQKRGPALLQKRLFELHNPANYPSIPQLRWLYLECEDIAAAYATRQKNWNSLLHFLKKLDVKAEASCEVLARLDNGRNLLKVYETRFGNPHKLRHVRSIFSKAFLYWLEHEKGFNVSCFVHFVAYSPKRAKLKPFIISDDKVEAIMEKGRGLEQTHPEFFKIFLLAASGGLRRSEIINLKWGNLQRFGGDWFLVLNETKGGTDQRASIPASTADKLVSLRNGHGDEDYVIDSPNRPKLLDRQFVPYLKEEFGITHSKPLHYLRKVLGALIATKHGIYAASKSLRHKSVAVTEQYYSDLLQPKNDIDIV
jgi:integrase